MAKKILITRKTTITLEEDQVKEMLRAAVGAPANADVRFDNGPSYIDHVEIEWSVEEDEK